MGCVQRLRFADRAVLVAVLPTQASARRDGITGDPERARLLQAIRAIQGPEQPH